MFREPQNLGKTVHFFWNIGDGLTLISIVVFAPIVILIIIIYPVYLYSKVYDLKSDFTQIKVESTNIFNNIGVELEPTLKWRSRSGGYYSYSQSYYLNPSQIQKIEKYIIQQDGKTQTYFGDCISKTIDKEWLYPRISRHYVETLSSNKAMGSFLIYGSEDGLQEIERVCISKKFLAVNLTDKDSKFDQIQLGFNQHYKILIINFTFNNRH